MKILHLLLLSSFGSSIPLPLQPFKDSIEIVLSPDDIRSVAEYTLYKIPEVKNNFKTTVKQKLLNRILTKQIQETNPNPDAYASYTDNPANLYQYNPRFPVHASRPDVITPGATPQIVPATGSTPGVIPVSPAQVQKVGPTNGKVDIDKHTAAANGKVTANNNVGPITGQVLIKPVKPVKAVEIEVTKPKGMLTSIIKGPSVIEEDFVQIFGQDNDSDSDSDEDDNDDEHIGYSNPSWIKNNKQDHGIKYYPRIEDESADDEEEDRDSFYDDK
ncbi:uncharacterized protein SPAPADRAFT_48593 [Spathaspora passalidarum NRRL Y-27907]|uniref:Uncharacterized protein n=1 Tax=Spathaspora passalidarum (strain NRRL Y-27907 / 11-Y1) TaxID=619300 RepID=G3AE80_SPAPN|nr:uncharacterized protein SPAPADRAFT_48593 [Spathaspora passalidarum NRRL Y-27907]EGW35614.1 hypothetical protein SPAPADRAFT_48593 [Spathaspora passalidarum NRRL Y-27907]